MKTKELIELLQKADPNGDTEVCVSNKDISYVYRDAAYWDGRLQRVKRDHSTGKYSGKVFCSGEKIVIRTIGIEDAIGCDPDAEIDLSDLKENMPTSYESWSRSIEEMRKISRSLRE